MKNITPMNGSQRNELLLFVWSSPVDIILLQHDVIVILIHGRMRRIGTVAAATAVIVIVTSGGVCVVARCSRDDRWIGGGGGA